MCRLQNRTSFPQHGSDTPGCSGCISHLHSPQEFFTIFTQKAANEAVFAEETVFANEKLKDGVKESINKAIFAKETINNTTFAKETTQDAILVKEATNYTILAKEAA